MTARDEIRSDLAPVLEELARNPNPLAEIVVDEGLGAAEVLDRTTLDAHGHPRRSLRVGVAVYNALAALAAHSTAAADLARAGRDFAEALVPPRGVPIVRAPRAVRPRDLAPPGAPWPASVARRRRR